MVEELFGKIKVEGQQQPPAEQSPAQVPPPATPSIPPPSPPQIPQETEVLENVEMEDGMEGEDATLSKLFMEFTSNLSSYEDDDLGVIFGRVLQEMIDRQLEVSDTTKSVVRRLRRIEAIMAHMLVGGKHKVFTSGGYISCECGGLKVGLSVPSEDKFVWDSPPKGKQEEEEDEEESGE